jgi:hypothetical protein
VAGEHGHLELGPIDFVGVDLIFVRQFNFDERHTWHGAFGRKFRAVVFGGFITLTLKANGTVKR